MRIYVNEQSEICDVGTNTTGEELTEIEILDEGNPFAGWSKGKICCYKVTVEDGRVVMMTPAVDSRIIRNFDSVSPRQFTKTAYIDDTSVTFEGIPSGYMTVYCPVSYTTTRDGDRVTVEFDALTEVTDITISII